MPHTASSRSRRQPPTDSGAGRQVGHQAAQLTPRQNGGSVIVGTLSARTDNGTGKPTQGRYTGAKVIDMVLPTGLSGWRRLDLAPYLESGRSRFVAHDSDHLRQVPPGLRA